MQKYIEYILQILPQMLEGLKITLKLFTVTLVLSLPAGLLLSLVQASVLPKPSDNAVQKIIKLPVRFLIQVYLWVFRGTPLLLQLFFFYFGLTYVTLPNGESLTLSMFTAATLAFSLNYAAYFTEIFRGGIIGVSKGQYEASKALGLTGAQTMRYVIVPQMIRTVIPPIANETIVLVKDTALASSIAMIDLLKAAQRAVNRDMTVSPYLVAAVFYLAITLVLTFVFGHIERRLSIPEQGIK